MSKRDYIKVTFVGRLGEEMDFEGVDIPSVGHYVEFADESGAFIFGGYVVDVKWRFVDTALGTSVRIYLS